MLKRWSELVNGGFGVFHNGHIFANINNYGKTPAVVEYMSLNLGPLNGLKESPEYSESRPHYTFLGFQIEPQRQGLRADNIWVDWDETPNNVFYGRIWYRDIFEHQHYSSFALVFNMRADRTIRSEALDIVRYPNYWKWT
jgi:hypothetical protein